MSGAVKPPSRRALCTLGASAALASVLPASGGALASTGHGSIGVERELRALELRHDARIGVYAWDTATGRTVRYRAAERFPVCSVFKTLAAAAVLRDLDRAGEFLSVRVQYTEREVAGAGHTPITGRPENLADGMTVAELCAATVSHSDNAAANLLLRELGGPTAITRFSRSIGDTATRVDRWEPELNSGEPWRLTDTTSPGAIGRAYARLVLGRALASDDRRRLTDWLLANTTGDARLRAGLPARWTVAEKTGTGGYGAGHDVGVTWPAGRAPIVLSVLTGKHQPDAAADDALIAATATLLADTLT